MLQPNTMEILFKNEIQEKSLEAITTSTFLVIQLE